jgi:DNA invertase Pin-like site-specific DNA recombinase
VIDEDLGKSGTSAVDRVGFQRLVSEVSLDHVGLILGLDMSRLARSNADWHRLLELCALFCTLIADLDGVYDPAHYNDRLLLGLKGTMSEAEIHVLKQRMHQGRVAKARRGELSFPLPTGYVWQESGTVAFDPDAQVQTVVRLVFRKFAELGTLGGVVRYLAANAIRLGVRVREGPGKGALVWRRPNRMTVQMLLKHPIYAGAYVYGRRQVDPRRQVAGQPRSGRVTAPPDAWLAFVPDRVPAYITWDEYEANQQRIQANRARAAAMGAVRDGPALLAGLAVCAHCGCRLGVHYHGQGATRRHSYACTRVRSTYGGPTCQHLPGAEVDAFVSQQVLAALAPAALDVSLAAIAMLEQERSTLIEVWEHRREQARYEVERAARQYHAVEPEHRLVARTLEQAWEERLAAQQQLEEAYHRFVREGPRVLSAPEREAIRQLAADLPALWHAATTTAADRKEILRQVIGRVVVDSLAGTEQVHVRIEWVGGDETVGEVTRPVNRLAALSSYPQLCARLRQLSADGMAAAAIAARLNDEGFHPRRPGTRFGAVTIRELQRRLGIRQLRPHARSRAGLGAQEWLPAELSQQLDLARSTLHHWITRGWVRARQEVPPPHRWIVWADAAELERLRQFHHRSVPDEARRRWTTPASPPDPLVQRS